MGIFGSFVSIGTGILLLSICHLKLNHGWRIPFTPPPRSAQDGKMEAGGGGGDMMSSSEILMNWAILAVFFILAIVGTVWAILEPKL